MNNRFQILIWQNKLFLLCGEFGNLLITKEKFYTITTPYSRCKSLQLFGLLFVWIAPQYKIPFEAR